MNAKRPAATAAGNVETSQRIVDVVLGALAKAWPLRMPAASQGTMNNVAMGHHGETRCDYYETMGGGIGASSAGPGISASQCHMTNTLNTPIESIESHYPLRVLQYRIREGSGGAGQSMGGDGLVREFEFLGRAELTILSERRTAGPWGLEGGQSGQPGKQSLDGKRLSGKVNVEVKAGQRLKIESPGGGGFGIPR